jgi:hypothetical protein
VRDVTSLGFFSIPTSFADDNDEGSQSAEPGERDIDIELSATDIKRRDFVSSFTCIVEYIVDKSKLYQLIENEREGESPSPGLSAVSARCPCSLL